VQAAGRIYLSDICPDTPRFVNARRNRRSSKQSPIRRRPNQKGRREKLPAAAPGKNGFVKNLPPGVLILIDTDGAGKAESNIQKRNMMAVAFVLHPNG
jgi:hypothetical protein